MSITTIAQHCKLFPIQHIITHRSCPDGLASAMILADLFPEASVHFVQYNTPSLDKLPAKHRMLFCDMTPPRARMQEFIDVNAIVLDHHEHAKDITEAHTLHHFGHNKNNMSGAMLAYRLWAHMRGEDECIREFAYLASVRDCWDKGSLRWQEACEQASALMFYGPGHFITEGRTPFLSAAEHEVGKLAYEQHLAKARKLAYSAYCTHVETLQSPGLFTKDALNGDLKRFRVAFINNRGPLVSDAAEHLRNTQGVNLIVAFHVETNHANQLTYRYSMRSDDSIDCGYIAKALGGGGHKRAAGFSKIVDDPYAPNPIQAFRSMLTTV